MYKVRCSQFAELLSGCGKEKNKLEWGDLKKMNESHIKLAIKIYNAANGFVSEEPTTLDMHAGIEREPEVVKMYDEFFGTNFYPSYELSRKANLKFEKSNEYLTGTRDFGDDTVTIDAKSSTDKNVFDAKKFAPMEVDYIIQQNGYMLLYGTPKAILYNALVNATYGQIHKMVSNARYVKMMSEDEESEYQDFLESNYNYDLLPLSQRIFTREVPVIENFAEIVKVRVETMNEWIEKNKQNL